MEKNWHVAYYGDGDGRERERVAEHIPKAHALAAILDPRIFHFPERRRMKGSVRGLKGEKISGPEAGWG